MPQRPLQVNAYEERLRNTQKPHEGGIAIRAWQYPTSPSKQGAVSKHTTAGSSKDNVRKTCSFHLKWTEPLQQQWLLSVFISLVCQPCVSTFVWHQRHFLSHQGRELTRSDPHHPSGHAWEHTAGGRCSSRCDAHPQASFAERPMTMLLRAEQMCCCHAVLCSAQCSGLNGCHRGNRGQRLEAEEQQRHSSQLPLPGGSWPGRLPSPSHGSSWLCVVGTGAHTWLLLSSCHEILSHLWLSPSPEQLPVGSEVWADTRRAGFCPPRLKGKAEPHPCPRCEGCRCHLLETMCGRYSSPPDGGNNVRRCLHFTPLAPLLHPCTSCSLAICVDGSRVLNGNCSLGNPNHKLLSVVIPQALLRARLSCRLGPEHCHLSDKQDAMHSLSTSSKPAGNNFQGAEETSSRNALKTTIRSSRPRRAGVGKKCLNW
ncbi:hypothetical protein Anapl_03245 [Anas platyrhynchos]|uniref:Uncharacterized protein n=1 Tax=Anas platyrhynchos TaxID=8839 RepID=R0K3Z2_ANAPL|nr:hypothetical protein Anapl_03245 [Anas platyrhynchos]